jgi:DNA-binding transcriptional LysR family regulator
MLASDPDSHALNTIPLASGALLSAHLWGELRAFLAVAKCKSFNRAAEMLGMSQPTVSRQVRRVQDVMGVQLIIPNRRGVRLTPCGEALAQAVIKMDLDLFSLAAEMRAEAKHAAQIVRISIADGLGAAFVAPSLQQFSARHLKIQVHLKQPLDVRDFRGSQTDIMIGACPVEASDLICSRIGCLHLIPMAVKDYIAAHGVPTRHNLEQHQFLQSDYYFGAKELWDRWNQAMSRGRVAYVADGSSAYAMLVKAALGIGLLGSYMVLEPRTVPIDLGVRVAVPLYVIAGAERLKARPVRLVFDWLSEMFANNPWFADKFRLDHPSSPYDAGFRKLINHDADHR